MTCGNQSKSTIESKRSLRLSSSKRTSISHWRSLTVERLRSSSLDSMEYRRITLLNLRTQTSVSAWAHTMPWRNRSASRKRRLYSSISLLVTVSSKMGTKPCLLMSTTREGNSTRCSLPRRWFEWSQNNCPIHITFQYLHAVENS